MPKYQALADIAAHYFLFVDILDVCPGESKSFVSKPRLALKRREFTPRFLQWRRWVYDSRLDFAWWALAYTLEGGVGRNAKRKLRFRVGPVSSDSASSFPELEGEELEEAWTFLLRALKGRAKKPLAFVYTPRVPAFSSAGDGQVVFENEFAELAGRFAAVCRAEGVGFVDLSSCFVEYNRKTGAFPCGFHNGRVARGHLNEQGLSLVAEAIVEDLIEKADALYAD